MGKVLKFPQRPKPPESNRGLPPLAVTVTIHSGASVTINGEPVTSEEFKKILLAILNQHLK
jgi:hypothetical protein